ncbi:MAG: ribosome maturation factor RimM [Paracoccaceae bacterium]|nr:ribosome maturation factor RimM [Paracoccaceae bacterium]MDE2913650.1 ribosome maturation factor RimM [Paracoccaceae bacterium]
MTRSGRVCLGRILGAHGVRGNVRIESYCDDPRTIAGYGRLETEDSCRSFDIKLVRIDHRGIIARLSGISSRESAETLKGVRLFVDRRRLPDLGNGDYYVADLIGLTVNDLGGRQVGTVSAVQNHGAGDILEVRLVDSRESVLLPFSQEAVPIVDLESGRITVDPPEGVF